MGFDLKYLCVCAAVQEERQRGRERGESEVESTSSFNEEMPVDKILDAEVAVEPKTEAYSEGSPSNSVRITAWFGLNYLSVFITRLRCYLTGTNQCKGYYVRLISSAQICTQLSECALLW